MTIDNRQLLLVFQLSVDCRLSSNKYETIRKLKENAGRFADAGRNLSQNTRFIY